MIPSITNLFEVVSEDLKCHGGDWTRPGFQALAIHRFGVWRMNVAPLPLRAPLSVAYRALFRFARNVYGIELPYSAVVGRRVVIEHQGAIVVHGNAVIGDDTILRHGVTLGNRSLSRPSEAPVIGRSVNIGAGAKILGDVHIGDGASIGANAVVVQDVPAGVRVGGVPAMPLGPASVRPSTSNNESHHLMDEEAAQSGEFATPFHRQKVVSAK